MSYAVSERAVVEQPTAVIAAETSWDEFPSLWRQLLDEIWQAVRSNDEIAPGRNVMLYRDDVPNVEVGVEAAGPFAPIGRIVASALPAGRVATTTHRGRYAELAAAHEAVIHWCDEHGLERTGTRWEIYGHVTPQVTQPDVEVYWLLR
jgi:effector-binding domain-containing protein